MSIDEASESSPDDGRANHGTFTYNLIYLGKLKRNKKKLSPYEKAEYKIFDRLSEKTLLECLDSEGTRHYLQTISTISHENIQKCVEFGKVEDEAGPFFWALVKPYTGTLLDFLEDNQKIKLLHDHCYAPSRTLTNIARGILHGLLYLHRFKTCHGNLLMESTNYLQIGGDIIVKLANFAPNDSFDQGRLKDWHDFGSLLHVILDKLDKLDGVYTEYIKSAAEFFLNVTTENLDNLEQDTEKLPIFWDMDARKRFIREFCWLMNNSSRLYVEKVRDTKNLPIPWNNFKYAPLGKIIFERVNVNRYYNVNINSAESLIREIELAYGPRIEIFEFDDEDYMLNPSMQVVDHFVCVEFPQLIHVLQGIKSEVESEI